jgi:hypothetical protein
MSLKPWEDLPWESLDSGLKNAVILNKERRGDPLTPEQQAYADANKELLEELKKLENDMFKD